MKGTIPMEGKRIRHSEFDYVKTLAILFMVIIHVIEELSSVEFTALPAGFWENFIQFGAGPLAAPVFIFSMGVGIVFSRNQEPVQLFRRGVKLLLVALALNICRDVIPRLIVCLISGSAPEWEVFRYQLFNIDVLHFAGLSFMLTALLKKLKVPVLALVPIGIFMQIAGNELALAFQPTGVAEILLSYIFNTGGDLACFPILPWYASLAIGILAGTAIKKYGDKMNRVYSICFWGGVSLLAGFIFACHYYEVDIRLFHALYEDAFYGQTFFHFLYNTLVIVIELSLVHLVARRWKRDFAIADFCGKNLTTIYVVQWMIIGWLTSFKGYLNLEPGMEMSVVLGILIAVVSIGITKLLPKFKW